MIIAIDFDGTIVEHEYPAIGRLVPLAVTKIKELIARGHKVILYTMRSGKELQDAVEYCKEKSISFWGINENPTQKEWTNSPKVYAQIYIDDAAYGCPLIYVRSRRPYVDWRKIRII